MPIMTAKSPPAEIQNAPAALRTLDKDRHRGLTSAEVLPDPVTIVVALFLSDFDANGDGKISKDEPLHPNTRTMLRPSRRRRFKTATGLCRGKNWPKKSCAEPSLAAF